MTLDDLEQTCKGCVAAKRIEEVQAAVLLPKLDPTASAGGTNGSIDGVLVDTWNGEASVVMRQIPVSKNYRDITLTVS